ncbi:hypothetical protein [uncultured Parabacteroides sp.]|uniref:hypothetical protein n=1 Tax=uncultured Parabacteroides sp. TaxID=512312 RepID=UPI00265AF52C|nr:hypothetical protein [uncultured Parabacteroides sp.]
MPNRDKSGIPAQGAQTTVSSTKRANLNSIEGVISRPVTPTQFHRAAMSIVSRWCTDVVNGRKASLREVRRQLAALESLYLDGEGAGEGVEL